jgi:hypothetical protein
MGKNPGQKPRFVSFLNSLETGLLPTRAGHCQVRCCSISPSRRGLRSGVARVSVGLLFTLSLDWLRPM